MDRNKHFEEIAQAAEQQQPTSILVRSTEAGTQEYRGYRAKLDAIHAAALEIQRKRGIR